MKFHERCFYMAKKFDIIAGPCSVESEEQILSIAKSVKAAGATMLRGGAFKPRTSPYTFQGLRDEGIKLLVKAKKETGLPIVSEITEISQLDIFEDVDVIQVGARNMYNYELLKELSIYNKPVLLKRGISATYDEWINASKYITNGINKRVILCERGVRGFDSNTRNILDIQAIPYIKKHSNLPIFVDPSHAAGNNYMIHSTSLAAVAAGCDGLMIEVHDRPDEALSDREQAITPNELAEIIKDIKKITE